jgi:hypothetical protein
MSQQAFSEARKKLKWQAFQELFETTVEAMYQGVVKRWRGYRLLAVDGTKINLPNDPELREYFGTSGAGNSSPCAQGSILYDIENDVIVDARIEPMGTGERTLAEAHITKLAGMPSFGKELILFDRGYPSMELITLLLEAMLLEKNGQRRGAMFEEIIELLRSRLIPIRSNRSIPRRQPRKAKFHHNHKSNC